MQGFLKRWRLAGAVLLAALALVTALSYVAVAFRQPSLESRSQRVHAGMTREQVCTAMESTPHTYNFGDFSRLTWQDERWVVSVVTSHDGQITSNAIVVDHGRPWWERARAWIKSHTGW